MQTKPNTAFMGILMLDTAFPRIVGDAGNVDSYPMSARTLVVIGAGSRNVVTGHGITDALTQKFIKAAQRLEAEGAAGIVSTCGFLVHAQSALASSVKIPIIASALSLYPILKTMHGPSPIGILTASEEDLRGGTLQSAHIPPADVRIAGLQDCAAFADLILSEKDQQNKALDTEAIGAAAVERAKQLKQETPDLSCILLECGNLPPYAAAIKSATGLPVYSILDAADLVWAAYPGTLR